MSDRTPCINPRCRRTAAADKFPGEMVCGKCFRALPVELRNEHRDCWRQIRKWRRQIMKTADPMELKRRRNGERLSIDKLHTNWELIRATFTSTEKPEGIEAFLEEMGM